MCMYCMYEDCRLVVPTKAQTMIGVIYLSFRKEKEKKRYLF